MSQEDLSDALVVDIAGADSLRTGDCRRLTGPGLQGDAPGAALEAEYTGFAPGRVEALWHHHARRVLDGLGWTVERSTARHFAGGIAVTISAPPDQLYSATFAVQTAWHFVAADLLWQPRGDLGVMLDRVREVMAREANPALLTLINAATTRGIEVMVDEDLLTLGHGSRSLSFEIAALPEPSSLDWQRVGNLPVGLITGTNGKTTTTRLAMAMARAAGKTAGLTSTDMVQIGTEVIERGDFSGPGGARLLLRDPRLEIGFLELARGGILRRGLPVRRATAAVVTNVAADHLGEYGITRLDELAEVKFSIRRGLAKGGRLILNADDPPVLAEAERQGLEASWFSLDAAAPQIRAAQAAGQPCAYIQDAAIWLLDGQKAERIIAVADIPIAMGGAARYNVSNALAACLLCQALGIGTATMGIALASFQSDPVDNPGRCNAFRYNGAQVFVDFAHNPHSIAAVTGALAALPAKRRFILMSHAGDRSDQDIRDLARGAFAFGVDVAMICELPGYLRGREPGEVSALLRAESLAQGMAPDHIFEAASPAEGASRLLPMLGSGDLALLLVHSERDQVFQMLADKPG